MNPQDYLNWILQHWYFFIIVILIIAVVKAIQKINQLKTPQYYSEIEKQKKIKWMELEFNPTPIRNFYYKGQNWRVYGEIIKGYFHGTKASISQQMTRSYTPEEIRNFELQHLKEEVKNQQKADYYIHEFLVRRKNLFGVFYHGEPTVIKIYNYDFRIISANSIMVNQDVFLIYRDLGMEKFSYDMIETTREDTERLMGDHKVNAQGQQQREFSRVRTDYSHELDIKEQEAKIEKEKKGGRSPVSG